MKKYRKQVNKNFEELSLQEESEEEEKVDIHSLEVVVERITSGLIGSLRIENDMNKPIFKVGDYALLRFPSKLLKKDFVLYSSHEEYFLRRIIKFKDEDIYVAGDNEKEYHIIHREEIVGKVVSRERKTKRLSFSLTPKKKIYTFTKVNLAYFRLKNRITNYEQEVNNESLELASQSAAELNNTVFENKTEIKYDIDLDSDLKSFLNPDALVLELREAMEGKPQEEESEEENEAVEDDSEYVDEEVSEEVEEELESTDEETEELIEEESSEENTE